MAQFDVYTLADGAVVVDVQSDFVDIYSTRLVIPLILPDDDASAIGRLNPSLEIGGETRLLAPQLAAAVRRAELNWQVGSLAEHDITIKAALDMLISGF